MATATQLREAFVKELRREGMKFELLSEEENIVVVPVKTRGVKFIVFVDFDEDGDEADTVNFVEPSIARVVDAAKIPEIIVKLNQVNSDYRFAKCYLNDARDRVACDYNLIVDERNAGPVCVRVLRIVVSCASRYIEELGDLVKTS